MNSLVSVVVPVYNREKLLSKCLDSILAQNYRNFEVLVIDDGSTDGSFALAKEYEKKFSEVRAIRQENGGVSRARNCGIENAKGDYIIFVDSDDSISPFMLADYFEVLEKRDYDLVCSGFANYDINGKFLSYELPEKDVFEIKDFWLQFHSLLKNHILRSPCNKLYKTSILKKNNILFDPEIQIAEDAIFNTRYYPVMKSVCVIKKANYLCLVHNTDSRLSMRYHSNFLEAQDFLFDEFIKLLLQQNAMTKENKDYLSYEYANSIWLGMENKYRGEKKVTLPSFEKDDLIDLFRTHSKKSRYYKKVFFLILDENEKGLVKYLNHCFSKRMISNRVYLIKFEKNIKTKIKMVFEISALYVLNKIETVKLTFIRGK